jgi:hypothetical protein
LSEGESSQEEVPEETVEEESAEETKQEECVIIPEHMKPLFECCKDFDEGKIGESDFFARSLIQTGEFMQNVKKRREIEPSE